MALPTIICVTNIQDVPKRHDGPLYILRVTDCVVLDCIDS